VYSRAQEQLGWVVAVRPVLENIATVMERRTVPTQNGRSVLVRPTVDGRLQFLTSINLERPAGWLSPNLETAEASAVMRPGILTRGQDIDGRDVVALARGVHAMPWMVVHTSLADRVLAATEARQLRTLAAFLLVTVMLLLVGLALWRHVSANRIEVAGARFGQFFGNLKRQHHFFETLLNSQPNTIAVLDENN